MAELVTLSNEELKSLQEKSFEIANYIVDFCETHNLRVYYYAGSMLGAVREDGFIPWDDDIDLELPAPDFNKLIEIWDTEADTSRYALTRQSKDYNDHTLSTKIRDNYTTFITDATVDMDVNQGLGIDIGPLHAAPNTKIGQMLQLTCAAGASLFKASRIPSRQSKLIKTLSRIILGVFRTDGSRYFMWHTLETLASLPDRNWSRAKYVREFSMFPYITWLFPRVWFDKAIYHRFEGGEVPIPVGYDGYLRKRYGDYMTPPPEQDRHPEHRIVFMDLNTPYKEYRGIKYFVQ